MTSFLTWLVLGWSFSTPTATRASRLSALSFMNQSWTRLAGIPSKEKVGGKKHVLQIKNVIKKKPSNFFCLHETIDNRDTRIDASSWMRNSYCEFVNFARDLLWSCINFLRCCLCRLSYRNDLKLFVLPLSLFPNHYWSKFLSMCDHKFQSSSSSSPPTPSPSSSSCWRLEKAEVTCNW